MCEKTDEWSAPERTGNWRSPWLRELHRSPNTCLHSSGNCYRNACKSPCNGWKCMRLPSNDIKNDSFMRCFSDALSRSLYTHPCHNLVGRCVSANQTEPALIVAHSQLYIVCRSKISSRLFMVTYTQRRLLPVVSRLNSQLYTVSKTVYNCLWYRVCVNGI